MPSNDRVAEVALQMQIRDCAEHWRQGSIIAAFVIDARTGRGHLFRSDLTLPPHLAPPRGA